ncbi:MAG TPA: nitrilase-related carbon-nitrogen hydrolase [Anaerolineae bacterium]|nr:nitrilase-related carbon-nitrogen hydrolase [Anaerolineae bacterium]HPL27058.1 nitrilase-related carbon-nitrogen hydrolase [Anaerolineae bacterium]
MSAITSNVAPQVGTCELVLRTVAGLALAALSGVLLTLAFPPYGLWPPIFAGLVPMVLAQHRVLPRHLSGLAYGAGIGVFFWGYLGGTFGGTRAPWMELIPLVAAAIAAAASWRDRAFHERTRYRLLVLQGAAVFVGIEMIRGLLPMVGSWGFVAHALFERTWLLQPVSLFGVYGLSLLILLCNYALALGALWLWGRLQQQAAAPRPAGRLAAAWLGSVALLLAAWTGLSLALLRAPSPTLRVAAVQPGASLRSEEDLARLYEQTRRVAAAGARFIVWPEGYLPFDPQTRRSAELQALAAETRAYLAIGYSVRSERGLRNEVTVLAPDGRFLGVYGKDHPVSFAGETSLTRGTYPAYDTPLGRLGSIICYDLDFTDTARKVARNGAAVIAVPSCDWPAIAAKHYSHVVFRAIENRAAMVKADIGYDSAIVDPYGRIVARAVSSAMQPATLVANVPLGSVDAPAIRLGDWIGWLALAGLVFFTIKGL